MKKTDRFNKTKKISDVISTMKENNHLPELRVRNEIAIEQEKEKAFLSKWSGLDVAKKAGVISAQVSQILTTAESVALVGRITIKDEPELFMYMVDAFYRDNGMKPEDSVRHADMLLGEFPDMALQDMGLFFKKFTFGDYGKKYGNVSFGKLMEFFNNFQKSVGYNLEVKREREHRAIKEAEGHRDLRDYDDNSRPENLE